MAKHEFKIEYEEYGSIHQLSEDEQSLIASAWSVRDKAHAPYSNFLVGAVVQTKNGQIIQGCNQEVANYKGSCSERVALDSVGAAGLKNQVAKIAIVGGPASFDLKIKALAEEEPIAPCGQCRQDIKEVEDLSGQPIVIILASQTKIFRFNGIDNLLPLAFGPADLQLSF